MTTRELTISGKTLRFETGKLAKQAGGSVIVRYGDSVVLVTACRAANPREGIDFLPLTVDYREYTYASGRIPGGFFKREGKPAEKEVLTSRCIDRPIRPLFPAGWRYETQIIALVLSADRGERHRRPCHHRRVGRARALGDSFRENDRRRPRRARRRPVHHQPDIQAAQREQARSRRRRQQRRPGDGRGGRERSDRGTGRRGARGGARGDQADRRRDRRPREGSRQEEAEGRRRRKSATTSTARSRRRCFVPLTEAMRIRGKLENYGPGRRGARRARRLDSRRAKSSGRPRRSRSSRS